MEYNDKNQITKKTTTTKKSFEFSYDKNGNILDDGQKEYTYTPFGALLTSTNPTSSDTRFKKEDFKGYTSHEQYFDLNLINMKGRMYDPTIGRFLSPDIFIQSPTNSQSFNRYAYVWNNPLKYTDPSGYYLDDGDDDFDFSDPYDDTKTTTTNNNTNNNTKSNDGWDTADLYDDTGTNVVGTVDFNANTGEFMSQNTVDGSQEGRLGGYDYSVDADGQYTTQNLETGEKEAGWNTGSYHQFANGVETFTDSAINYHSIGYKGKTIEATKSIVELTNITLESLNTPAGRIGLNGISGAISLGSFGLKRGGYYGALAFGLTGLGLGFVIGGWNEFGFDVPISKGQVAMQAIDLAKGKEWD